MSGLGQEGNRLCRWLNTVAHTHISVWDIVIHTCTVARKLVHNELALSVISWHKHANTHTHRVIHTPAWEEIWFRLLQYILSCSTIDKELLSVAEEWGEFVNVETLTQILYLSITDRKYEKFKTETRTTSFKISACETPDVFLFSTASVPMIEVIYSQQNVYQLGICPLLCAPLTNSSMEQYGTLGSYLNKHCIHACVCVWSCSVTICSHQNRKPRVTSGLNLFRRQNWVVSLLICHNNKCSETNSCFIFSTILTEPLFPLHWA